MRFGASRGKEAFSSYSFNFSLPCGFSTMQAVVESMAQNGDNFGDEPEMSVPASGCTVF